MNGEDDIKTLAPEPEAMDGDVFIKEVKEMAEWFDSLDGKVLIPANVIIKMHAVRDSLGLLIAEAENSEFSG